MVTENGWMKSKLRAASTVLKLLLGALNKNLKMQKHLFYFEIGDNEIVNSGKRSSFFIAMNSCTHQLKSLEVFLYLLRPTLIKVLSVIGPPASAIFSH